MAATKNPTIWERSPNFRYSHIPVIRTWRAITEIKTRADLDAMFFLGMWGDWTVPVLLNNDKVEMRGIAPYRAMELFNRAVEICRIEDARKIRESVAMQLCLNWINDGYAAKLRRAAETKKWEMIPKENQFWIASGRRPSSILTDSVVAGLPPPQVQEEGIKAYLRHHQQAEARQRREDAGEREAQAQAVVQVDMDT